MPVYPDACQTCCHETLCALLTVLERPMATLDGPQELESALRKAYMETPTYFTPCRFKKKQSFTLDASPCMVRLLIHVLRFRLTFRRAVPAITPIVHFHCRFFSYQHLGHSEYGGKKNLRLTTRALLPPYRPYLRGGLTR